MQKFEAKLEKQKAQIQEKYFQTFEFSQNEFQTLKTISDRKRSSHERSQISSQLEKQKIALNIAHQ